MPGMLLEDVGWGGQQRIFTQTRGQGGQPLGGTGCVCAWRQNGSQHTE